MIVSNLKFKLKHNVIIRIILKPFMEVKFLYQKREFDKSVFPQKISKLRESHKGERCFVIGNGPSLRPEDLDLISNEYSFAANRIYNIYERTKWRPTAYVSTDMDILFQEKEKIESLNHSNMFINYDARKWFGSDNRNITYLFLKGPFEINRNKFVQNGVSNDVADYSTKTQTVTCVSMELAMYMGFKEIYLIGVDHNFAKVVGRDGKMVENKDVQSYFEGMKGGDSQAILYVDDTTACYEIVNEYAKKHGVKIYNATRGGKLEVFERTSLESIFS